MIKILYILYPAVALVFLCWGLNSKYISERVWIFFEKLILASIFINMIAHQTMRNWTMPFEISSELLNINSLLSGLILVCILLIAPKKDNIEPEN